MEKDRTDPVSTVEGRTTKLMNASYADGVKVCNTPRENALIARNVMNMATMETNANFASSVEKETTMRISAEIES